MRDGCLSYTERIILDCKRLLSYGEYDLALDRALTLPDLLKDSAKEGCRVHQRYNAWCNNALWDNTKLPKDVIYHLRNSVKHDARLGLPEGYSPSYSGLTQITIDAGRKIVSLNIVEVVFELCACANGLLRENPGDFSYMSLEETETYLSQYNETGNIEDAIEKIHRYYVSSFLS